MKKLITIALIVITTLAVTMAPQQASAAVSGVVIQGKLTKSGQPVPNGRISIRIDGNTLTDLVNTDPDGNFSLVTNDTLVPPGSTVRIEFDDNKDGIIDVTAEAPAGPVVTINVDFVPTIPVPEYGLLGGIAAGGAGLVAVAWIRRRQARATSPA
jgi:hypothetical protein